MWTVSRRPMRQLGGASRDGARAFVDRDAPAFARNP
jgi:hypothetical protein